MKKTVAVSLGIVVVVIAGVFVYGLWIRFQINPSAEKFEAASSTTIPAKKVVAEPSSGTRINYKKY